MPETLPEALSAIEARQDRLERRIDEKLERCRRLVAELTEVLKPDSSQEN